MRPAPSHDRQPRRSAIRAWRSQGRRLGVLGGIRVGREVVAGEGTGELVDAEGLEAARRGEVAQLAIGVGERVVGDLADERLDERVLAALRATAGRPPG